MLDRVREDGVAVRGGVHLAPDAAREALGQLRELGIANGIRHQGSSCRREIVKARGRDTNVWFRSSNGHVGIRVFDARKFVVGRR